MKKMAVAVLATLWLIVYCGIVLTANIDAAMEEPVQKVYDDQKVVGPTIPILSAS